MFKPADLNSYLQMLDNNPGFTMETANELKFYHQASNGDGQK